MPKGKNYLYIIFNLHLFLSFSFSITGTERLEEAQARLDVMQSIAVKNHEVLEEKKKDFELAKNKTSEAQSNVQGILIEIEAIKVKGQFEETFLRFPHIAEQIFESLEVQSLFKCQEVSKYWQKFIFEEKPFYRQLENYTNIPKPIVKRSLKDYDFQTIQKMAHWASISHEKAVNAIISFGEPSLDEPKGPTLFYYILFQEKLNNTQLLLAKLMLLNKVKKPSTTIPTVNYKQYQSQNQEEMDYKKALFKLINDARIGRFGEVYDNFKKMVISKKGKYGSLWNWLPILLVAVTQNHLTIVKLILEQVQDIQQLHGWGKTVLGIATYFGHRDICEFILDKTQGVDLLVDKNGHRENLIQMAKGLGHKEICTLYECFVKKYR